MKSKRIIIIGMLISVLVLLSLLVVAYSMLFKKSKIKVSNTSKNGIVEKKTIYSTMGILQDLNDQILYQNGNFKLLFKVDRDTDKIYVSHNDLTVIETDYNHAAQVRVNFYENLYIVEIYYTMAQCPTLNLYFLSTDGNIVEQSDIVDSISRIEYFDDVNKIILYKEPCMICENCNTKYTYELVNYKFKLLEEETDYGIPTKVESNGDYSYYAFDFNNYLSNTNDSYSFTIGDYNFKYILTKIEGILKHYDLYINDKKVYSGLIDDRYIKIKMLGKYIIFTNTFSTDIRSTILYIYDGISLKEINELDEVSGMVIDNITVNSTGILVNGTRLNNGPSIVYNGKLYDIYNKDTCDATIKELKEDFIIKQDYFYRYIDSKINFIPEKSNRYILRTYAKSDEFCKNSIK